MGKKAARWEEERLPGGYAIAWRQSGPTAVSRTSGTVQLLDPNNDAIEMCAGWAFGEEEDPEGLHLENRKAEYRELAQRHARGDFPYDTIPAFAGSLDERTEHRDVGRGYIAAVNQPEEE